MARHALQPHRAARHQSRSGIARERPSQHRATASSATSTWRAGCASSGARPLAARPPSRFPRACTTICGWAPNRASSRATASTTTGTGSRQPNSLNLSKTRAHDFRLCAGCAPEYMEGKLYGRQGRTDYPARGAHLDCARFYGAGLESGKRKYTNKTIHATLRDARSYLSRTQRDRDLGVFFEPSRIASTVIST